MPSVSEILSSPPAVVRTHRDLVTVSGPDAASYLQGQLSQDLTSLDDRGAWTFVLAPQGKVEAWARIRRSAEDRFELMVGAGAGEVLEQRLKRFLLRTRADVALLSGVETISIRGGGAAEVVAALESTGVTAWLWAGWPGLVGLDVAVSGDTDGVVDGEQVISDLASQGIPARTPEDLEAVRIAAGVPAWGSEIDGETIPATIGQWAIDASVSFTKGCYTGQELVARIDSRGGNVPRVLHRVEISGPPPASGTELAVEGHSAGPITSAVARPGGSVALAWVPRSVTVDGTGADAVVDGHPARVLPPPAWTGA